MKNLNNYLIDHFTALEKYHADLSDRLKLNQDPDIANYVNECVKKEHKWLKNFESDGLIKIQNIVDRNIILEIKSKVENFINQGKHLNPIRKPQGKYVVPSDSKKATKEFLDNLTDLELKTPTVSIKDPLVNLEDLFPLVFHSEVISKITAYFKTLPMLTFVKVIKHFPNDFQSSVNEWHVDGPPGSVGSSKLLKVIYYLDDINNSNEGPFCYIKGSHLDRITYNKRSFSDDEVNSYYSKDKIKQAYAQCGDAIFTRGELTHKAGKPTTKPRTLIIVNYCIHEEYLDTKGLDFIVDKIKIKKQDIDKLKFKNLSDNLIKI